MSKAPIENQNMQVVEPTPGVKPIDMQDWPNDWLAPQTRGRDPERTRQKQAERIAAMRAQAENDRQQRKQAEAERIERDRERARRAQGID